MTKSSMKVVAVGAFGVALVVAPVAQASHSETAEYAIGTTPVVTVTCAPECLGPGFPEVNIGGYVFGGVNGEVPVQVDIADSSDESVRFTVAQDLNNDRIWGDPGEPNKTVCGTATSLRTGSAVPFRAGKPTLVTVRLVDPGCPGGLGLGGTITMTWDAVA